LALVAALAGLDQAIGYYQRKGLEAKRAEQAKLERLAHFGLRTGIDEILYEPEGRYRVRFRIQNATEEPFYVMLPLVRAFVQVGYRWTEVPVAEPPAAADEGLVVRLIGERQVDRLLSIETRDDTAIIPGYHHMRFNLEAYVSTDESPLEAIGEKHEDLFLYLKDGRLGDAVIRRANGWGEGPVPAFIPLRAWTLVPKAAS
jgi:hypothetical protein